MTGRTVSDIGEFAVIARATHGRSQPDSTLVGPGDDAAVVAAHDGRVVATTDMLVQGRHFRLDWSTPEQVGRKAIAQNGADIAAMGATPTGYLVALGCPPATPLTVTDGLTDGLWREAETVGAGIIGGDLVAADNIVISITALGDLAGRKPVLLSGSRAGDVVAVCGRLGWSAAGLELLAAGSGGYPELLQAHRVPVPPYAQGPAAADAGATAMTDVSDGLIADLTHIADASGVGIDLTAARLPIDAELRSAAADLGADVMAWVLTGGEDHALVATFPREAEIPEGWVEIGAVVDGTGVTVDGASWQGNAGWRSF